MFNMKNNWRTIKFRINQEYCLENLIGFLLYLNFKENCDDILKSINNLHVMS